MSNLMHRAAIDVVENGNTLGYLCMHTNSGFPVYYPPKDRVRYHHSEFIDDCIFLPISEEEFSEEGVERYGYRFIFYSAGTNSVGIEKNPWVPAYTYIEIREEVCRIKYIVKDGKVYITDMLDPLMPPVWHTFQGRTSAIGYCILTTTREILDTHVKYYSDKTI